MFTKSFTVCLAQGICSVNVGSVSLPFSFEDVCLQPVGLTRARALVSESNPPGIECFF